MTPSYTHIRIETSVKDELSILKKKASYSDYVAIMLNYFRATNTNPESMQISPFMASIKEFEKLNKRIGDVINVVRGIEKSKIDPMWETVRLSLNPQSISPASTEEKEFKTEDVETILLINQQQEEKIEELKKDLKKHEESVTTNQQVPISYNKTAILQAIEEIKKNTHTVTFNEAEVKINRNLLHSLLDRISKEVQ